MGEDAIPPSRRGRPVPRYRQATSSGRGLQDPRAGV